VGVAQELQEQAVDMDVALPALAGGEVEFEISIGARRGAEVIERTRSQRRASEIGVQDHAGGVDERPQRVTQRLAELAFDCRGQAAEREIQRFLAYLGAWDLTVSDSTAGDFLAKVREHEADTFGDGGMTLTFDQRLYVGLAEKFVRRRQFLKQSGLVCGGHRGRLCHREVKSRHYHTGGIRSGAGTTHCMGQSGCTIVPVLEVKKEISVKIEAV
jgi:hypothetical protein